MSQPSAPQTKALKPIDEVRGALTKMEEQFKAALPPHVTVEKFNRVVMTALQNSPKLLECNRASFYSACMMAAQDGLLPDGREAALVPFKGVVKFVPMVAGILKKVRNSGELATITSQIVRKDDRFRYWVDSDGEHIEHEPSLFGQRGDPIGVYGIAKTKDGSFYLEVMTAEQVDAVRKISKATDGPWDGPFESEMWRKSVLKRLSKRLPMSTDLEQVFRRDDDLYDLNDKTPQEPQAAASEEPKKKSSRLSKIVEAATDEPPQEDFTEAEFKEAPPALEPKSEGDIPI